MFYLFTKYKSKVNEGSVFGKYFGKIYYMYYYHISKIKIVNDINIIQYIFKFL